MSVTFLVYFFCILSVRRVLVEYGDDVWYRESLVCYIFNMVGKVEGEVLKYGVS